MNLPPDEELLGKPEIAEEFRNAAEAAAYMAGAAAVEAISSRGRLDGGWPDLARIRSDELLDHPIPPCYDAAVLPKVMNAAVISDEEHRWWREHLNGPMEQLDSRVLAFFNGWKIRGTEIKDIQRRRGARS